MISIRFFYYPIEFPLCSNVVLLLIMFLTAFCEIFFASIIKLYSVSIRACNRYHHRSSYITICAYRMFLRLIYTDRD